MSDPQPNTAPKSCASCGIDVTNRKRTKDAQGRYYCEDCVARAKTAKAVANPPPAVKANQQAVSSATKVSASDDNAFLLEMGGSAIAMKGTVPCHECGRALTEGTVICTGCGYNLQTGKRLAVKVVKTKAAKDESGGGESLMENAFALSMIYIIVVVGLLGGAFFEPLLLALSGVSLFIASFGITIATIVMAWKEDGPGWGLACIFCGIAQLVWILTKCDDDRLKALYGTTIFISIIWYGVLALAGPALTGTP
jgi:ribosomal protein L37E